MRPFGRKGNAKTLAEPAAGAGYDYSLVLKTLHFTFPHNAIGIGCASTAGYSIQITGLLKHRAEAHLTLVNSFRTVETERLHLPQFGCFEFIHVIERLVFP